MRRAAVVIFLQLCMATIALANGAMGLALEMFEYRTWAVYVVVTVLLEALIIGRAAKLSAKKSIAISVGANFITAVLGGVAGCCAPVMHIALVGSQMNPNPFLNAVVLLSVFGVISALIEMLLWTHNADPSDRTTVRRATLIAHAVGIPIALGILLLPERPYQGLERFTMIPRARYFRFGQQHHLQDIIREERKIPKVGTVSELLEYVNKQYSVWNDQPELWTAGYVPEYHRFDTKEMKRQPMELNFDIVGKPLNLKADGSNWKWLVRYRRNPSERYGGILVDMNSGEVKNSFDPSDFETGPVSKPPVQ